MGLLDGKSLLITGASRGIGAATARRCIEEGASCVLHASKPGEAAETLLDDLPQGRAHFIYADLADPAARQSLFDTAVDHSGGRLHGLVNNAGVFLETPVDPAKSDLWERHWTQTIDVNLRAPADLCRAAISHYREKGGGAIVNLASRAAHRGDGPDHAAYAASKAGLVAMSKTWARAHAGEGVDIYCVAPGWVETRMAPQDIEARAKAVIDIPLGRVAAPEEVAETVVFLLSGRCRSMVGATIDINGASYVR